MINNWTGALGTPRSPERHQPSRSSWHLLAWLHRSPRVPHWLCPFSFLSTTDSQCSQLDILEIREKKTKGTWYSRTCIWCKAGMMCVVCKKPVLTAFCDLLCTSRSCLWANASICSRWCCEHNLCRNFPLSTFNVKLISKKSFATTGGSTGINTARIVKKIIAASLHPASLAGVASMYLRLSPTLAWTKRQYTFLYNLYRKDNKIESARILSEGCKPRQKLPKPCKDTAFKGLWNVQRSGTLLWVSEKSWVLFSIRMKGCERS